MPCGNCSKKKTSTASARKLAASAMKPKQHVAVIGGKRYTVSPTKKNA